MSVRILIPVIAAAGLVSFPMLAEADSGKVTICHATSATNPDGSQKFVTLKLPPKAVRAHFDNNGTPRAGHELDYLGPCIPDPTTTTEVPPSSTTSDPTTTSSEPPVTTQPARTTTSASSPSTSSTTSSTSAPSTSTSSSSIPTTVPPSSTLAFGGTSSGTLASLAAILIGLGGATLTVARRR